MARARSVTWRQALAVVLLAAWVVVAGLRATRLVAAPETPVGQEVAAFVPFARQVIPETAAYLYVEPAPDRADPGITPRLRYELYPRQFENAPVTADESTVHALMARERRRYIVVPRVSAYPPGHWLRREQSWLRRVAQDDERWVLEVVDQP